MSSVSVERVSGSNSQVLDAGVALRNAPHDDLSQLALDTAMVELDMALETVSTMVFELQVSCLKPLTLLATLTCWTPQEQRHAAAAQEDTEANADAQVASLPSTWPAALADLQKHLQKSDADIAQVEMRLQAGPSSDRIIHLQYERMKQRLVLLHAEAGGLQALADQNDYLQIYTSASRQADDMIVSLEKVCMLCNDLVQVRHVTDAGTA